MITRHTSCNATFSLESTIGECFARILCIPNVNSDLAAPTNGPIFLQISSTPGALKFQFRDGNSLSHVLWEFIQTDYKRHFWALLLCEWRRSFLRDCLRYLDRLLPLWVIVIIHRLPNGWGQHSTRWRSQPVWLRVSVLQVCRGVCLVDSPLQFVAVSSDRNFSSFWIQEKNDYCSTDKEIFSMGSI